MSEQATSSYNTPDDTSWNPRSRPIISCLNCRRKKQKCDRRLPCNTCIKSGRPSSCQYAPGQEPGPASDDEEHQINKRRRLDVDNHSGSGSVVTTTQFNVLQDRVTYLEKALEVQSQQMRDLLSTTTNENNTGTNVAVSQNHSDYSLGVGHKSHDLVLLQPLRSQFPDLQSFIDVLGREDLPSEIVAIAQDLHHLSQYFPQPRVAEGTFKIHDNVRDVLRHMERILPPEEICILLVNIYFEAFEGPLRVLHHSARTEFRKLFDHKLSSQEQSTCLPILLAVISIVSTLGTLLECEIPILHGEDDGIGAYQLLRNYLLLLSEGEWECLPNLQIAVLSLKQHRSAHLSAYQTWRWSGEVVRRAMGAGIHLTSSKTPNLCNSEIRRRLWLTVLEMDLTLAIASNMPVTCPVWDDVLPLNVDDDQLYPSASGEPQSNGLEEWTDGICQYLLAQSFNARRSAYSLVASDTLAPYDTVLQHTRRLEQIIHDLPVVFRLTPTSNQKSDSPYRLLAKMELDFLLRRPLNACYAAHGAEMPADDEFKEARIPWVQGCSFSLCFQDLFDPKYPMIDLPRAAGLWDFYHNTYRWDVDRFFLASCLELQRLRSSDGNAIDSASKSFHGHALHSPAKIMGWTADSMTVSLEETIDPMIRRLERHGSDFEEVVRWAAVMGILRVDPSSSRDLAMLAELRELSKILLSQLMQRDATVSDKLLIAGPAPAEHISIEWLRRTLCQGTS